MDHAITIVGSLFLLLLAAVGGAYSLGKLPTGRTRVHPTLVPEETEADRQERARLEAARRTRADDAKAIDAIAETMDPNERRKALERLSKRFRTH